MQDESPPPLDPLLSSLYDAERAVPDVAPDAMRTRLADRLGPLFDTPASGGDPFAAPKAKAPVGPASSVATWAARGAALVAAAGVGAGVHAVASAPRTEIRYVDRVVVIEAGAPPASAPEMTASAPSAAPMPSVAPRTTSNPDESLARERVLIETARAAVSRRDGTAALAAIDRHAQAFPRGQLAEEREALAVHALVLAGRGDDARARGARFLKRYPQSVFVVVVNDALTKIP